MNPNFTVTNILKQSWEQFTQNISYVYYLLLPMFVCSLLGILFFPEFLYFTQNGQPNWVLTLPSVALVIVGILASLLSTVSLLFFFRSGKKDTWATWQHYVRLLPKYIWVTLLQGLLIFVGLLFFIIPGIYFALRYAFVAYRALEYPTHSVADLFRAEAEATKGKRWTLLGVGVVLIVGVMLFGFVFSFFFTEFMTASGNPVADFLFEILIVPFYTVVSVIAYIFLWKEEEESVVAPNTAENIFQNNQENAAVTPEPIQ